MAYIVFGPYPPPEPPEPPDPGASRASGTARRMMRSMIGGKPRPFGFQAQGTAEEVVGQLQAAGGGFAAVTVTRRVEGEEQSRQVYVNVQQVLYVYDPE